MRQLQTGTLSRGWTIAFGMPTLHGMLEGYTEAMAPIFKRRDRKYTGLSKTQSTHGSSSRIVLTLLSRTHGKGPADCRAFSMGA